MSNLDAAQAHLLQLSGPSYLLGQMPSLLNHVQRHLNPTDARRTQMERIAASIGIGGLDACCSTEQPLQARTAHAEATVARRRAEIVAAARGASSAALREQTRVRSFRNVLAMATLAMAAAALILAAVGWFSPASLPLCFTPEEAGEVTVVCTTEQSGPMPVDEATAGGIDEHVAATVAQADVLLVELVGFAAAGIAAAGTLRRISGSSEPYGVPLALALLKLPTGAMTALLGLLLMRGGFIPGLSALDTSAQILAWAIIFGFSQQLFTRLVDQHANDVLDSVRGGSSQVAQTKHVP